MSTSLSVRSAHHRRVRENRIEAEVLARGCSELEGSARQIGRGSDDPRILRLGSALLCAQRSGALPKQRSCLPSDASTSSTRALPVHDVRCELGASEIDAYPRLQGASEAQISQAPHKWQLMHAWRHGEELAGHRALGSWAVARG